MPVKCSCCEAKRNKAREIGVGELCSLLSDNLKHKLLSTVARELFHIFKDCFVMLKSFAAFAILLFFCCLPQHSFAEPLKIGLLPASDTLALHVAKDEGLFARHGLEVELVPFQSALEQSAAVRAGALHGWFGDIITMLLMHESGIPQRVVATMSYSGPGSRFFGIAVAPGSRITTAEELKNAGVAISRATIIEYILDCLLREKGFADDFVSRMDIKQISVRLQLLLAGKADAALLPEPLLSLVEAKGARVIVDNSGLSMPLAICSLRKDAAKPEVTRAFQAALAEAMGRINADAERYRRAMLDKKLLPEGAQAKYAMLRYDPAHTPLPLPTERELDAVARWMLEKGLLRRMPQTGDVLHDARQ